ncbi:MAG: hypothetical protein ACM4AI_13335 [Acidobacteriota bacterium]
MNRVVLVAAIAVTACTSRDVALLPDGLWVSVHDANDRRIGGFAVRTERYLPTMELGPMTIRLGKIRGT